MAALVGTARVTTTHAPRMPLTLTTASKDLEHGEAAVLAELVRSR